MTDAALLLVAVLLLLPVVAERSRHAMSAARQSKAPGQIANLPQGATHYRWSGREGDPIAVCIHGLSTPSFVFAATERSLVTLGYRVLSYDLFGRGYSARVPGRQNATFFRTQLQDLLAHQGVTGPITLLGFSMGGQIATDFAARDDRVERLILVAPSGLVEMPARHWVWTLPILGDWVTRVFGGMALRRELVEHKSQATVIPDFEDRQAAETQMRGYLPAVLSSRRNMLSRLALDEHRWVADDGTPVLAIWGTADPVIPRRAMGELSRINPVVEHVELREAGHNLLQTHPSEVAAALQGFLQEQS